MTIDMYSVCPCGNGKKIKFCKCKDSVGELDSVLTMIGGGQSIPALDRLSKIIDNNPDAAWALAIRGRVLLQLREYGALAENAERFSRLQPGNPLALAQQAASLLFSQKPVEAADKLLEALTESGPDVDWLILDIALFLAFALSEEAMLLSARLYTDLILESADFPNRQMASTLSKDLSESPRINRLLKTIPASIPRPADASWGERFDEADALLQNKKIKLAEAKFNSLAKTHPGEPAILSGLLSCAIWRADSDQQSDTLRKLSDCESLDEKQRTRFLAMSLVVKPDTADLSVPTFELEADVEDVQELEMAMLANSRFLALPPELISDVKFGEEEVAPRAAFEVLDREKISDLEKMPAVDDLAHALGLVMIYGKQTDRPARLNVIGVHRSKLQEMKGCLAAVDDKIELTQKDGRAAPILLSGRLMPAGQQLKFSVVETSALRKQWIESKAPDFLTSLELPILGHKSLQQCADDESTQLLRLAVVRAIEQYDDLSSNLGDSLTRVYQLSGVEQPATIKLSAEQIDTVANEDLIYVDISDLPPELALSVLQRATDTHCTLAACRVAEQVLQLETTDEQFRVKLVAYNALVNFSPEVQRSIDYLEQAKAFADSVPIKLPGLLFKECQLRMIANDKKGLESAVLEITKKYKDDPDVLAQLEQMLKSVGGPAQNAPPPGIAPSTVNAPETVASSGGLWTPDQGSPAPQATPPSQEKSKLWVPGAD